MCARTARNVASYALELRASNLARFESFLCSGLGVEMGGRWVWLCEKLGSPIVEMPILYRVLTQNSRLQRKDSTNTGQLAREHLSVIICAELYAALCHCGVINLPYFSD